MTKDFRRGLAGTLECTSVALCRCTGVWSTQGWSWLLWTTTWSLWPMIIRSRFCAPVGCGLISQVLPGSNRGDNHIEFVTHDYTQLILRTCWLRSDLTGTNWTYQSWTTTWSLWPMIIRSRFCAPVGCGLISQVLPGSNRGDNHIEFVTHDYTQLILRTCWLRSDLTGTNWIYQSWTTTWSLWPMIICSSFCALVVCGLTSQVLPGSNRGDHHMEFVTHDYTQQILRTCWLRSDLTGTRSNRVGPSHGVCDPWLHAADSAHLLAAV